VVTPDRIVDQWSDEMIEKHVKDLVRRKSESAGKTASSSEPGVEAGVDMPTGGSADHSRGKALRVAVFKGTSTSARDAGKALLSSLRSASRNVTLAARVFDELLAQAARFRVTTKGLGPSEDDDLVVRRVRALQRLREEDVSIQRPKTYLGIEAAWEKARAIVAGGCTAIREYEASFHDCQVAASMLDPLTFSRSFDIIVTSFSTLKQELALAENTLQGIEEAQEGVFATKVTEHDPQAMCLAGTRSSLRIAMPLQRAVFNAASAARQLAAASDNGLVIRKAPKGAIESFRYSADAPFCSRPDWLPESVENSNLPAVAVAFAARLALVYQARGNVRRASSRIRKRGGGSANQSAQIPSVLVLLEFWRVVLDEAQMIEPARKTSLAVAMRMAREGLSIL